MKTWKKALSLLLAAAMLAAVLTACGGSKGPDPVNTKTGTYDEMVEYLKAKGYIAADATPVDINTTAGYTTDNTGGEMPFSTVADKAEDWGGLWLFWFEDGGELYQSNFSGIGTNSGTIVIMGGANILQTAAYSGNFAIAFAEDYAQQDAVLADFNALPKE